MTKAEIKALIARLTHENTTEKEEAEILNAIVDAMPEDKVMIIDWNSLYALDGRSDVTGEELLAVGIDINNCVSYSRVVMSVDGTDIYGPIYCAVNAEQFYAGPNFEGGDSWDVGRVVRIDWESENHFRVRLLEA